MLRQERTGENMAKTPFPSIFYVYGNRTYQDEIEAAIANISNSYTPLNISNPSGCGFKLESFDIGDMRRLDIILETYEAWIQPSRRMEFNDLETNILDLDCYLPGCDNRISSNDIAYVNFVITTHKGLIAFRNLNFSAPGVAGEYVLVLGSDTIRNAIPAGASITDNKIYRKTLLRSDAGYIYGTDAIFTNAIMEFKGKEIQAYSTYDRPFPIGTPLPVEMYDKDTTTYKVIPWDIYPRCTINFALKTVKCWSFIIRVEGTSGDTYTFNEEHCYAKNAPTFEEKSLYAQMNAQHPIMNENTDYQFYIDVNFLCTQLRFSFQSIEHPFPSFPAPLPEFRFLETIIKVIK